MGPEEPNTTAQQRDTTEKNNRKIPTKKNQRKSTGENSDSRKSHRRPDSGKDIAAAPENACQPGKHTTSQQKGRRRAWSALREKKGG